MKALSFLLWVLGVFVATQTCAHAQDEEYDLLVKALLTPSPTGMRVIKWEDKIEVRFQFIEPRENSDDEVRVPIILNSTSGVVDSLQTAVNRQIDIHISPAVNARSLRPPASSDRIVVYFLHRSEFVELFEVLRNAQQNNDDLNVIVMLLNQSISDQGAGSYPCFSSQIVNPDSYIKRYFAVINMDNNNLQAVQCVSRVLLQSLGFGQLLPPIVESAMAHPSDHVTPTAFDLEAISLLYNDEIDVGWITADRSADSLHKKIEQILHGTP